MFFGKSEVFDFEGFLRGALSFLKSVTLIVIEEMCARRKINIKELSAK